MNLYFVCVCICICICQVTPDRTGGAGRKVQSIKCSGLAAAAGTRSGSDFELYLYLYLFFIFQFLIAHVFVFSGRFNQSNAPGLLRQAWVCCSSWNQDWFLLLYLHLLYLYFSCICICIGIICICNALRLQLGPADWDQYLNSQICNFALYLYLYSQDHVVLICDKSYLWLKIEKWKGVMACNVSPVAMFFSCCWNERIFLVAVSDCLVTYSSGDIIRGAAESLRQ